MPALCSYKSSSRHQAPPGRRIARHRAAVRARSEVGGGEPSAADACCDGDETGGDQNGKAYTFAERLEAAIGVCQLQASEIEGYRPEVGLYFVGIAVSAVVTRRRERRLAATAEAR